MRRKQSVFLFSLVFALASGSGVSGQEPDKPDEPDEPDLEEPIRALEDGFTLGGNYPNPFSTETTIPFELHEGLFADGETAIVSLRVLNVVLQSVASLTALDHPGGGNTLDNLEYFSPGRYEASWDGRDRYGEEVAAGMYWVRLTVNGSTETSRVEVARTIAGRGSF